MNLIISPKTKSSAVKIGAFRVFGEDKNELKNDDERIKRFDEKWQFGLSAAVEKAIIEQKTIQSNMVEEMLQKQFWKSGEKAASWLRYEKAHFQFTYGVLCVVQVEKSEGEDEYIIDQLWCFTFPDAIPERFCFQFDIFEDKEKFENFARSIGQDPRKFAKEAILGRIEDISQQQKILEAHRSTLAHCVMQRAQLGLHTPPYVLNQMQESRKDIQRVKEVLRGWHVSITDLPDDTE